MRNADDVISVTRELVTQIREAKAAAQLVGRDSLLLYRTESDAQYDITNNLALGETKRYRLILQYATARGGAMLTLNIFHSTVPDVMSTPSPRPLADPRVVYWEVEASTDAYTSWIITTSKFTSDPDPLYMKYFIDGTDTGIVTIDEI